MKKITHYIFEKLIENEFGEEWEALPKDDDIYKMIDEIVKSIPKAKNTDFTVGLHEVVKVKQKDYEDNPHYIAIIHGGQNGNGEWTTYIDQIKKVFDDLKEQGRAWLVDLKNDCLDDVWTMRLAFTLKK